MYPMIQQQLKKVEVEQRFVVTTLVVSCLERRREAFIRHVGFVVRAPNIFLNSLFRTIEERFSARLRSRTIESQQGYVNKFAD